MNEAHDFKPEWFSPPGETVKERLRITGLGLADFAWEAELDEEELEKLFDGRLPISDVLAQRLEATLGVSSTFWLARDAQFRGDVLRLARCIPAEVGKDWLRQLPIKDMISYGWVEPRSNDTGRVAECLRYFDVPSVDVWTQKVEALVKGAKLRTSATLKSNPAALSAWLRKGEIEADRIRCEKWDSQKFLESLSSIRKLTWQKDPQVFLKSLREICSGSGVAVVVARSPSGCRASGATKFLGDDKALILLSFRYLSDDHFWFTFFHEAAHLLLHGKDKLFLEGEPHDSDEHEREANEFSAKILIPEQQRSMLMNVPLRKDSIIRLAVRIGVAPGIIVGQLQHSGRLKHNYLNFLKRRFRWSES